jgi:ATP-dependent Clp protease ATP-binding subunit ClpA
MFERFTDQARAAVVQAQAEARRLGHNYIGCEHLLLAVVGSPAPAGAALRELDVTPASVESAIRRMVLGPNHPPPLDRDALAVLGIDLDVVRERVEAAFGPGALTRTAPPRRRWRRRRRCYTGPASGHLPFTPRAKKCLERSLREAVTRHDHYIGVEHLALALSAMTDGLAPRIFADLGVPTIRARTEIQHRYRQAS